jgi:hypothetical protein
MEEYHIYMVLFAEWMKMGTSITTTTFTFGHSEQLNRLLCVEAG